MKPWMQVVVYNERVYESGGVGEKQDMNIFIVIRGQQDYVKEIRDVIPF